MGRYSRGGASTKVTPAEAATTKATSTKPRRRSRAIQLEVWTSFSRNRSPRRASGPGVGTGASAGRGCSKRAARLGTTHTDTTSDQSTASVMATATSRSS